MPSHQSCLGSPMYLPYTLALCLETLPTLPSYPLGGHLSYGVMEGQGWLCKILAVSTPLCIPVHPGFPQARGAGQAHGSAGLLPGEVVARRAEEEAQAEGGSWEGGEEMPGTFLGGFISRSKEEGEGVGRTKEGSQAWDEMPGVEPAICPAHAGLGDKMS